MRVLPEHGGHTQTDRRCVRGVPELIVEVSQATRYTDLGPKFDEYERAGVLEYIIRALDPDQLLWFVLQDGKLVELPADSDGLYRSRIFPGLWLDSQAMIVGNTRRLREVLDRGLATDEHASFVARLTAARAV
ncbi:MAG: Uma2 family endonuclease [Isosphaeraceae bacterium]